MATSTLRETRYEILTADELKELLNDLHPVKDPTKWEVADWMDVISSDVQGRLVKAIATYIAPAVAPQLFVAMKISDVIELLQDAMKYNEIKPYLSKMTTSKKRFKLTTHYYEWLSGSGNHTGYYIEEEYAVI